MNALISDFLAIAKFVDLDQEWLAAEIGLVPDYYEPHYAALEAWAGSYEAVVLMLAYAHTMAFHCASTGDESARMLVKPYWDRIVAAQPALSLEWFEPEQHYFEDGSEEAGLILWKC